MCPMCLTAALLSAGGASSGVGAIVAARRKWRTLRWWFADCRRGVNSVGGSNL
jgi:hypothetical protein